MKKYYPTIISLIFLFFICSTTMITMSEDDPCILYGYVYLDNQKVIPNEVILLISNEEYSARIYENGYYFIEFDSQETGEIGSFTIKITDTTWEINDILTIESQDFIFNQDIYLSTTNQAPNPPEINGQTEGTINTQYTFIFKAIDIDNDKIKYAVLWDDDSSITISELLANGEEYYTTHSWEKPGIYNIQANAKDENNQISETSELTILIDTHYVSYLGYLIDDNSDGIYDNFYSNTIKTTTPVLQKNTGYVIDTNEDYFWDYEYYPVTGELIQINEEQPTKNEGSSQTTNSDIQWQLILGIIFFIVALFVLIITYLIKNQHKEIKETTYKEYKKPTETKIEKPKSQPKQVEISNLSQKIDNLISNQIKIEEKEPELSDLKEIQNHIDKLKQNNKLNIK